MERARALRSSLRRGLRRIRGGHRAPLRRGS